MTPLETIMKRLDDIEFRAGMPEGFFSPEETQALWTQSRKEDIPALVAALRDALSYIEKQSCEMDSRCARCVTIEWIEAALGGEVGKDG